MSLLDFVVAIHDTTPIVSTSPVLYLNLSTRTAQGTRILRENPSVMPRKGFEKVRTGCITCKARKVKCDESRPACQRCLTGGRICEGYRAPPLGSFSWGSLLQVRPSIIPLSESSSNELRNLDFFRCNVAPALTGPLGKSFWTRAVCQMAIQEPAARYAVLAISSLYGRFDPFRYDSSSSDGEIIAMRYYNKAMRQTAISKQLDIDTTLLVAILFICIEFLRGNIVNAIRHCRHGTHILESTSHVSPDISAIINHLNIFPFFFGATLSDFPLSQPQQSSNRLIHDLPQAMQTMDCLMSRAVALLRAFDPFRLGIVDIAEIPSSLFLMQQELCQDLDIWRTELSSFTENVQPDDEIQGHLRMLEVRWHVCKIWLQISSHKDETFSDTFRDQFGRVIALTREDVPDRSVPFKFEMGLAPLLYFVVIKCRFLKLRLEALFLLRTLGHARESLWDTNLLYAVGRRVIEREHGMELPLRLGETWSENACLDDTLPGDSQRIRDSYLEDKMELHVDSSGSRMMRRRIIFFVLHGAQEEVRKVQDWVYWPDKAGIL
ncbi:hypothetical protein F5Y07DRAFT_368979 [Xylaria sp. FL0933]|nr:hypothetical protein F5Y07DRAFT_368979 [Xylaria sp. FL0933]